MKNPIKMLSVEADLNEKLALGQKTRFYGEGKNWKTQHENDNGWS